MKRFFKYLFITFILILLFVFSLLCSNILFKHITLPLINVFVPVKISVKNWNFRPWKSLNANGLVIADISSKTDVTNFYLSANLIDLNYKASSLFSDVPLFYLVKVEGVNYTTSSRGTVAPNKQKKDFAPGKSKKPKNKKKKLFVLPDFPVRIKKLVIKNLYFSYSDNQKTSFGIDDFNLAGIDIEPENSGSALAKGSFFYSDGKNVFMDSLPFGWEMNYTVKKSIIPNVFFSTLLVSNAVGHAGKINLSPFTAELNINMTNNSNVLDFSKCLFEGYWNGNKISTLFVTGKIDLVDNIINCQFHIDVQSNNLYQALFHPQKKYDISQSYGNGIFNCNADLANDKYKINGKVVLKKIYAKKSKKLPAVNFAGIFNIALNHKLELFKIKSANFIVEDKAHPMIQLKISKPILINLNKKDRAVINTNNSSKISLVINDVNLKYINYFTESKNIIFNSGNASGKIDCDVLGIGDKITLDSSIIGNQIDFSINKSRWQHLGIKLDIAGNINNFNSISLSHFNAVFSINKKKAGEIAAGGYYKIHSGTEKIAFVANDFSGSLIRPLIDIKGTNKKIDDLILDLKILAEQKQKTKNRKISAFLNIKNSNHFFDNELEKLSLNIDVNQTPDKLIFNNCKLSITPGKWDDNSLKLTGEINLKKNSQQSDLTLQSEHFDSTALLNTIIPIKKSKHKKKKNKNEKNGTAVEISKIKKAIYKEPVPPKLQFLNLNFKTHIDQFIARDMIAAPLSFDFIIKSNKINFITRNMIINEGNFDLDVKADLNVTGYIYSSTLKVAHIPLTPILELWAPEISDKIVGKLNGDLSFTGRGFSKSNIVKNFRGKAKLYINDGHLKNMPFLTVLSEKLKIKELSDYSFNKVVLNAHLLYGTNFIDNVNIEGKSIKMGIDGTTTINNNLDLNIYLALSGRAIARIFSRQNSKFRIPFTGALDKFYELPLPVKIDGKIGKPKLESNIKDFVPTLIKMLGSDAIKSIGKLFGNDNDDDNDVEKDGVELFRGLLNTFQKKTDKSSKKK